MVKVIRIGMDKVRKPSTNNPLSLLVGSTTQCGAARRTSERAKRLTRVAASAWQV